jgi:hypothetical protein
MTTICWADLAIRFQSAGLPVRIATDRVPELDARAVRSVVVASCEDDDLCFRDDVDEAVLVVDPP